MLAVPFGLGVVASGPAWVHLPLAVVWLVGYLDHFALSLWLRSRRKGRYLPPVRFWTILLVVPGLAVVVLRPDLLRWAVVAGPLLAVSLWCAHRRTDRSLLSGLVTVLAACLALPVAFDAGTPVGEMVGSAAWPQVQAWTVVVLLYFCGTVLYVKTVIRERGRRGYLVASVLLHACATVVVGLVLAAAALPWAAATVLFGLLTARAAVVPRGRPRPLEVGVGEVVASVVLVVVLVLGAVSG